MSGADPAEIWQEVVAWLRVAETDQRVATMTDWTSWSVAYRYPDLAEPEPIPSPDELTRALQAIAQLADALKAFGPPAQTP
jgi:hypothetical protein